MKKKQAKFLNRICRQIFYTFNIHIQFLNKDEKSTGKILESYLPTNILHYIQFLNKNKKSSGKILESYLLIKILHSISQLVKERWNNQTNKQIKKKRRIIDYCAIFPIHIYHKGVSPYSISQWSKMKKARTKSLNHICQ